MVPAVPKYKNEPFFDGGWSGGKPAAAPMTPVIGEPGWPAIMVAMRAVPESPAR